MKRIFNLFLVVSFIFLFIFLIRQEYIIPDVQNGSYLLLSFLALFAGFYLSTRSWQVALNTHGFKHSGRETLLSHGLSVFAKYIPGKVWVILGRAGYLSKEKQDLKTTSFVSLKEQLIYMWAGFFVSTIPTLLFYGIQWISVLVLLMVILLTLFLFVKKIHALILKWTQRLIRKELDVPLIRFQQSVPMIGAVLLIWLCWTGGFYLFMLAFSSNITPVMMFAFPLSVCLGLIAIILPGGLGLREGIIIGYLTLAGLSVEEATTISFFNRLWFICGELFLFLLATAVRLTTSGKPGSA
jgi:uncharacterized membrane protein YbhN (UPF0104 family)